ncbi:hypothetical protein PVAP13_3KG396600 [Panicum virgatum]|uniref:Uncharacterized protein n=1 Tax=Panicum virgatum TaxID=38727 RepID=A0A8T0V263_PANVG|nr:hypothetical protein PVAP13_3KG396600 [Panicum virgatum]
MAPTSRGGGSSPRHERRRRLRRRERRPWPGEAREARSSRGGGGSPSAHDGDGPLRRTREVRPSPTVTAVARGAGYEGRRSVRRFGRPKVTNSSDPVASAASFGDDLLQSFVYACGCWLSPY